MNDDDLRAPFLEGISGASAGEPAVDLDRIMAALIKESPLGERLSVIDLTTTHPAWARAWQEARSMLEIRAEPDPASIAEPTFEGSANRPFPAWAVLASVAAAAVLVVVVYAVRRPSDAPVYRDAHGVEVHPTVSGALPRAHARLAWDGVSEGSHVVLSVMNTQLEPLDQAAGLGLTEHVVSPSVLAGLPSGSELLWSVEVTHSDGTIRRSPTIRTPLQD